MSDSEMSGSERDELPFKSEWEVGVQEAGDPDHWDHYHPLARSESEAREKARDEAKSDFDDPIVYMATGPYEPRDPARVSEEMIEEVFGS